MSTKIKVGGIILAAGLSMRFGDEKLLADFKGRPVGSYAVRAALRAELEPVILVTRPELAPALVDYLPGLRVVNNHQSLEGLARSLRLGLEALDPDTSHALILLADQPLVTTDLINRFVDLAGSGTKLASLSREGEFCPPALFGRDYFPRLAALEGDQGGRSLLADLKGSVTVVDPDEPLTTMDIDRPQDLDYITRRV